MGDHGIAGLLEQERRALKNQVSASMYNTAPSGTNLSRTHGRKAIKAHPLCDAPNSKSSGFSGYSAARETTVTASPNTSQVTHAQMSSSASR